MLEAVAAFTRCFNALDSHLEMSAVLSAPPPRTMTARPDRPRHQRPASARAHRRCTTDACDREHRWPPPRAAVRAVPSVRAAHARHVQQRVLSRGAAPAVITPHAPRCAAPHRHHSRFAPHRRVQQPWSEVLDLGVSYQGREARPPLAEANLPEQLEVGILCDLRIWARACPEAQLAHLRLLGERLAAPRRGRRRGHQGRRAERRTERDPPIPPQRAAQPRAQHGAQQY